MKTKKIIFISILVFIGFLNIFSYHQGENLKEVSKPITADDNTLIYCNFENSLSSFGGETGLTNGNWEYMTSNPLVGSYSVTLAGTSKNHIKWNYGSALAEGTIECFFHILSTDVAYGCDYILEGGDYYDAAFGIYHLDNGTVRAQIFTEGNIKHTLQSSIRIYSNQIYHFALTWGPRGMELWINGEMVASDETVTAGLVSYAQYYGIGNTPMGSNTQCSDGYWDEFRLSNIQRSSFPQNVTDYSPPDLPNNPNDPIDPSNPNSPNIPGDTNYSAIYWILGSIGLIGVFSLLIVKQITRKPLKDQPQKVKTSVGQKQPIHSSVMVTNIYTHEITIPDRHIIDPPAVGSEPISSVSKDVVEPILCSFCGTPLDPSQMYCEKCGYKKE